MAGWFLALFSLTYFFWQPSDKSRSCEYNIYMTSKKWKRILILVFFFIALVLLVWGYLPAHRVSDILNLAPGDLHLPEPTGWETDILALF